MKRSSVVITSGLVSCLALWACGGSEERSFVAVDSGSGGAGATGGSSGSGGSGGATGGASGSAGAGGSSGASGAGGSAGSAGSGGSSCGSLTDCGGTCVDTNTDDANCGKCERSCLATACVGGQCQPEAIHAETGMSHFTVDATHIYYVVPDPNNASRRAIRRKSIAAGAPQNLALDQASPVVEVIVDATHVYWAGGSNTGTSYVRRVPKGGGTVQTLSSGTHAPSWLAANSSTVFFTASDPIQVPGKTLHKVNKDGGSYQQLVAGDQTLNGVAASSTYIFYAEVGTTQALRRRSIGTGTTESIVTGQQGIRYVAHDANEVFWTATGAVRKADTNGTTVVTLGTATGSIEGLAVDATDVYWTELVGQQRNLMTSPRSGGGHHTLLTAIGPHGLSIGAYQVQTQGTWVYYLNAAGDDVSRVAK